ncbi:unnamed protein product [Dibothriocephalus latus]|uniref:Reverse transcriptase domain-containing protein n=1 Tax=Dibothriocephalus latus TaxID=60516 RepID=A0A3P7Q8I8_DIBLA|nr:unnamed protein product [Dibothriocephalus latus]
MQNLCSDRKDQSLMSNLLVLTRNFNVFSEMVFFGQIIILHGRTNCGCQECHKVRIRVDFSTGLNAALDRHQYPLIVPEDIFARLNGGTCSAKLNLSDAYLQIEVNKGSRDLLTINSHRGLLGCGV